MNKKEFIENLRFLLSSLSENEIEDIIYDYEEHFTIGIEEGKSQEQIVSELGELSAIASQYLPKEKLGKSVKPDKNNNLVRGFAVGSALFFFNLIVVLGPYIGVVGALIGFYAGSIAVFASGFATVISSFVFPFKLSAIGFGTYFPVILFAGIGLIAMGALWFIGNMMLTKLLFKLSVRYLRWNVNIIKGS